MRSATFPPVDSGHDNNTVCLRSVFLHVTKACNLRCAPCYFSAREPMPGEMTTGDFADLWPQLAALRPVKVVFTGGEPLLRADILELLRGLKGSDPEHHVLRCLNTNGHLASPELARNLVGLADEVRVSLDGLRERNDAIRGRGNFDTALRALEFFYDAGFEPKVLVTITAMNVADLEELICLLVRKGFTRISLNNFRPMGRGKGRCDWRADAERVQGALSRAWERCYPDEPPPPQHIEQEQTTCGVGRFLNILPDGDVFPCHVLTSPEFLCGNVREKSLVEICRTKGLLGRLAALDFRELAKAHASLSELASPGTCMGTVYPGANLLSLLTKSCSQVSPVFER